MSRTSHDDGTVDAVIRTAGQLALAAQAVLDAKDDAIGRLRRALLEYDRQIIELHRRTR